MASRIFLALLFLWPGLAAAETEISGDCAAADWADEVGDLAGVVRHLTACMETAGLSAEALGAAYYRRAEAHQALGASSRAVEDYSEALRLQPELTSVYFMRGVARGSSGDYTGALADLTRWIDLNPSDANGYLVRALVQNGLDEPERAIADLDRTLKLDPENGLARYLRGEAHLSAGAFDLAIVDFTRALELEANVHVQHLYGARCEAHSLNGLPLRALIDCNRALREAPDDARNLDRRAMAYWLAGQPDQARADLVRAREIEPTRPDWQERFKEFDERF